MPRVLVHPQLVTVDAAVYIADGWNGGLILRYDPHTNKFTEKLQYDYCAFTMTELRFSQSIQFPSGQSKNIFNYKKHNTVKFLIAITPSGSISFVSKCWGGRVSDKELTQQSGFLDKLEPTDEVVADRGFLIADEVALRRAKLIIPAFTKGKQQLSQKEVEFTRQQQMCVFMWSVSLDS